jgi:alpha-glucoside transport system permease protein
MSSAAGFNEPIGKSISTTLSSRTGRLLVYALVFFWTIPTLGLFLSSFRPEREVKTTGWWTLFWKPKFTLDNYTSALSSGAGEDNLVKYFGNSIRITIPAVLLSVGVALIAAYAFSWMDFRGRDWLFTGVVALLMVPLQMSLIPLLRLFSGGAHIGSLTIFPDLNLNGKVAAVWIAHTCFGLPFCTFMLKNFVSALPREVIEAAKVDGASHVQVFTKLVVPLSVPAIASLCIFQFMWIWNDYLIGRIFGGGGNAPITAQLANLTGTRGQSWHLLTAASMVSMLLPLVVFFALQRFFVRGLLAGAVKG